MRSVDCTLVLFCKRPAASKRRLAAAIGSPLATELAELLLGCALEDLACWPGPVVLSPADAADCGWAAGLLERDGDVVAQDIGNLGERLAGIDKGLRKDGRRRLLFIGADAPGLTRSALLGAASALRGADVVLGTAEDGGVVFMGNAAPWPVLGDLPWSTERLADELAMRCVEAGLSIVSLGPWQDVDRIRDLPPLAAALAADARPARCRLREWLTAHGWIGKRISG